MATLACVHHLEQPFLGHAEAPLRRAGVTIDERSPTRGDPLPALAEVDGIISFGGAQSVLDVEQTPRCTPRPGSWATRSRPASRSWASASAASCSPTRSARASCGRPAAPSPGSR